MKKKQSNYKILACFDTETNNNSDKTAYAICYQLSILSVTTFHLADIDNTNVNSLLDVSIDRHFTEICSRFDNLIEFGKQSGIVPVVMVHNLAFELWIISSYLNRFDCSACCKSTVKPLTITLHDDSGNPILVFWDTLSFWGKSLDILGDECGYPKLTGCWDYEKQRTPDTELTELEYAYAKEDVIVPWVYMGYYLRLNPEISESDLALRILTKTSVVRYKSNKRCGGIHIGKKTTGYTWFCNNRRELPKSNEELMMMHASARGGFTYCSRNSAGKIYKDENGLHVMKYDANSMHICHALSHYVPSNYIRRNETEIMKRFQHVISLTKEDILKNYHDPFAKNQFYGRFRFTNIRLKEDTVFYRNQVTTFAQSRFSSCEYVANMSLVSENEGGFIFNKELHDSGWCDWASSDAEFAFGKFYSASECILILNEMSAWELAQQFTYDSVEVVSSGYVATSSILPTDKTCLSFNEFYKAKSIFKRLRSKYEHGEELTESEFPSFVPLYLRNAMISHDKSVEHDVESFYLSVKSELNALYGIEATNEAKNEIFITKNGLVAGDSNGIDRLPKNPKAWYQYGMHIVGWSRIHQILFMLLLDDYVENFISGDTDSHKIYTFLNPDEVEQLLEPLHTSTRLAYEKCIKRASKIRDWFPMDELGFYEYEGTCEYYMAAWNKSYMQLIDGRIYITLAGLPCNHKIKLPDGRVVDHSYNTLANKLLSNGESFDYIASTLLGYNVSVRSIITGLNVRVNPEWATFDECGEPCAIYLHSMTKVLGDTSVKDNLINSVYACKNNSDITTELKIIDWPLDSENPIIIRLDTL